MIAHPPLKAPIGLRTGSAAVGTSISRLLALNSRMLLPTRGQGRPVGRGNVRNGNSKPRELMAEERAGLIAPIERSISLMMEDVERNFPSQICMMSAAAIGCWSTYRNENMNEHDLFSE